MCYKASAHIKQHQEGIKEISIFWKLEKLLHLLFNILNEIQRTNIHLTLLLQGQSISSISCRGIFSHFKLYCSINKFLENAKVIDVITLRAVEILTFYKIYLLFIIYYFPVPWYSKQGVIELQCMLNTWFGLSPVKILIYKLRKIQMPVLYQRDFIFDAVMDKHNVKMNQNKVDRLNYFRT